MNFIKELLVEMGNSRSKTEDKITDDSWQPLLHIIKILRYDDSINYNHHIFDINSWFIDIGINIDRYKGKRLKHNHLLNWMLYDHFRNNNLIKRFNQLEKIGDLRNYNNLPKLREFEEISNIILDIYPKIIKDLLSDDFETITEYLPKD